jgi:hypothetical protein
VVVHHRVSLSTRDHPAVDGVSHHTGHDQRARQAAMLTVSDANASGITVSGGTPARSSGI